MDYAVDTVERVREALQQLRRVLNADQWHSNTGLKADIRELDVAWSSFRAALYSSVELIQRPQPGYGLMSLWLRIVYERGANVSGRQTRRGWSRLLLHDDDDLLNLVTTDWQRGYELCKYRNSQHSDFPDLFPGPSSIEQLRTLAVDWESSRRAILDEARTRRGSWAFSQFNNSGEIKLAGQLLIKAVDQCEIRPESLDEELRDRILKNLETPGSIVWGYMTGEGNPGLATLISDLTPPPVEAISPSLPREPYPRPRLYARDKWIYENVPSHTKRALSLKLKTLAKRSGWKIIEHRNAFKDAADRWADYHGLPHRRFNDE